MFGFLKDKLKKVVDVFTKATTEEEEKPAPIETPKKEEKKPQPKQEKKKTEQKKPEKQEKQIEQKKEQKKQPVKQTETKKPLPPQVEISEEEAEAIFESTPTVAHEHVPLIEHPITHEEAIVEKEPEKKGFFKRIFGKQEKVEHPVPVVEKKSEQKIETKLEEKPVERKSEQKPVTEKEESGGFFGKLKAAIVTKKLSREEYEKIFDELEIDLLENNVALEVVDKLKEDLWTGISTERFNRFSPEKRVQAALTQSISELFIEPYDILKLAKEKEIYVICAIGINGSGKTTTLAKLAQFFKDNKLEPVLAAGDTFRAAAIQQLEEHANKIGVKIIKQQYGADAAAVAYDAIHYAKANKCRVVLIDTAGRLHSNTNLMEEMKKIVRVAKPDTTIFIGEATTGNDCVEQAVQFSHAVQIDGIVLSKVDVDERGGAALSISYVTRKPILFFGTGQTYKDLEPFSKEKIMSSLEL